MKSALMLVILGATPGLFSLGVEAAASGRGRSDDVGGLRPLEETPRKVYAAQSRGWYWIYGGVAHAQTFVSRGTRLERTWLRPARLNARPPAGVLRAEIRDETLHVILAQGQVRPEDSERAFRWLPVEWTYSASLTLGRTYVLVLLSPDTSHDAPWVVNAVYRNVYPEGRHLGYADDLLFSLAFEGEEVHVGPPFNASFEAPVNSGLQGAPTKKRSVALAARAPRVPEAAADPIGVIPRGVKMGIDGRPIGWANRGAGRAGLRKRPDHGAPRTRAPSHLSISPPRPYRGAGDSMGTRPRRKAGDEPGACQTDPHFDRR